MYTVVSKATAIQRNNVRRRSVAKESEEPLAENEIDYLRFDSSNVLAMNSRKSLELICHYGVKDVAR